MTMQGSMVTLPDGRRGYVEIEMEGPADNPENVRIWGPSLIVRVKAYGCVTCGEGDREERVYVSADEVTE